MNLLNSRIRKHLICIPSERHKHLRRIFRTLYKIPGAKLLTRNMIRDAIKFPFLSLKNKQRLYNFFSEDTQPSKTILSKIQLPNRKHLKLLLDLREDLSRMWYFFGYDGYERGTANFFCKLLKSKSHIIDIGSNIGYYSFLAASYTSDRGEIHSFEPNPDIFNWLKQNSCRNDFRNLHLNQIALSDKNGLKELFLPTDQSWSTGSLIRDFVPQNQSILVQTMRLDTYCLEKNIHQIELIRMDVEGNELNVLKGMGDLLEKWHPDIICEVLQPYERDLNHFFHGRSYRKFLIKDDSLVEVDHMTAHSQFRDYYLSCSPSIERQI